jgi:hypothetical protein
MKSNLHTEGRRFDPGSAQEESLESIEDSGDFVLYPVFIEENCCALLCRTLFIFLPWWSWLAGNFDQLGAEAMLHTPCRQPLLGGCA